MGPGGEILDHALHTESSQDPGESRPCRQAALPHALPPGITLRFDITGNWFGLEVPQNHIEAFSKRREKTVALVYVWMWGHVGITLRPHGNVFVSMSIRTLFETVWLIWTLTV